jgi:hypothetical protein
MATYKNPKYTPLKEAGTESVKKYLRDTPLTIANVRSDEYAPVKTDGIKIRGTGAATKGVKARGPMA